MTYNKHNTQDSNIVITPSLIMYNDAIIRVEKMTKSLIKVL